jgi:hypothetical protein
MNHMNMYDILNKFRALADNPATAAAAEQVEKLNGVKKDRLDEKYQGFEKTVKAVAKNPKVKDPEAVAAAIGREKYGKEKFQKAAAAGKKLGEGEMDESGLQAYLGKKKYGKEGMAALQKAGRDGASKEKMAKIRARHDKMDEGKPDFLDLDKDGDKKEPMKKAAQDAKKHKKEQVNELSPDTLSSYADKARGQRNWAAGRAMSAQQGNKSADPQGKFNRLWDKRAAGYNQAVAKGATDIDKTRGLQSKGGPASSWNWSKDATPAALQRDKGMAEGENQTCMECGMYEEECNCTHEGYMPAEEGNAFSGAVAKAKANGIQRGEKISVGGKQYPLKEKLSVRGRKKFAALAPPKDKITFADKIAGAKKEVDEMLGDVAAEALKGAVKGVKKKVEGKGPWPGTSEYKSKFGEPGMKKGEKKSSSSGGEIEKTAKGIKHTARDRSEEPDTDEPKSGEKRSRGRPKKYGDDKPRQERETAKSRKKDRTAHGQAGFKADKKKDKKEVDEKAVSKKQQRFMGMVHATQKGEKAPSAAVSKVAKSMGKKDAKDFASTKHKGLPEKVKSKKKEESVEETTTSGSVAPGAAKPAKSSGMQFGKGIYDSINRELEKLIAEGMTINMTQSTEGGKQMYVTATDEDVDRLADLLKMSGIERSEPEMSMGPEMGSNIEVVAVDDFADEGPMSGEMDENAPDWPTNDQFSNNALQYSGGLNKPKSTGQTTAPVLNRDKRRQGDNMDAMLESRLRAMLAQEKR